MSDQEKRCEYCWHPPRHVEGHKGLHNEGCPVIDEAAMAEWKRGRDYGLDDNRIQTWQYRFYTPAFVFGCRVGNEELDAVIDEHAESRYFG